LHLDNDDSVIIFRKKIVFNIYKNHEGRSEVTVKRT
jgi:hypothetical protein